MNKILYTRCWHEQSGVAERSDADDRLRRALNARLYSSFLENRYNFTVRVASIFVEKYKWCTEFTRDAGASSREWRSGATPTTDCEAP